MGDDGKEAARRVLRWDFAFILGYSGLLATLSAIVAVGLGDQGWDWAASVATWSSLAAITAGALDVVENIALLSVINKPSAFGARLVQVFAIAKFALVLGTIAIIAAAAVIAAARRT